MYRRMIPLRMDVKAIEKVIDEHSVECETTLHQAAQVHTLLFHEHAFFCYLYRDFVLTVIYL